MGFKESEALTHGEHHDAHTGVQLQQFGKLNHCNWDFDQNENRAVKRSVQVTLQGFTTRQTRRLPVTSMISAMRRGNRARCIIAGGPSSVLKDGAATPASQR